MSIQGDKKHVTKNKASAGWKNPAAVSAGFMAFLAVCGLADRILLASDYILKDPVTEVRRVYVDPEFAQERPIDRNTNSLEHIGNLTFPAESDENPTAAAAASDMTRMSRVRESIFRSRFESFSVVPAEQPAQSMKAGTPKTVTVSASAGCFEKMQAWKEQYPDVVGYINIPGTNVDYPVVQASSNLYYEHLDINKNYSVNGVIWADQDVTPSSKNTIIYGHNWTNYSSNPRIGNPNDVMFAQITAYQHQSFAQNHPVIEYANANGDGTWVIFGAFYTQDLNFYINANLSPVYLASKARQSNLYPIDVDVLDTDQVLTLSTCTRYFGNFPNQRFLIMARKLRDGEKLSVTIG